MGKRSCLGTALILPTTGLEITSQTWVIILQKFLTHLMRVGSMGHSGFTNWVNKKEKNNSPLKENTQNLYNPVATHTCKHWSPPDQGIDSIRHQWQSLLDQSTITAKLGLLQALLSQFLPVTKVQAQRFIRTGQSCKASAKKLVLVLELPSCLLREHFHSYVIFFRG